MTEKRFKIDEDWGTSSNGLIGVILQDNERIKVDKVVDLLNALYEENQRLIKMLDNVANYMQKEHKDVPIDDFVEWWNNIVTEGLEND